MKQKKRVELTVHHSGLYAFFSVLNLSQPLAFTRMSVALLVMIMGSKNSKVGSATGVEAVLCLNFSGGKQYGIKRFPYLRLSRW